MRSFSIVLIMALLLCSFSPPGGQLYAQSPQEGQENGEGDGSTSHDYEPYREDEFPKWARDLRRFETLFIGSLPFAFFFSNIGYDTYTYVSRGYDEDYLPLFFGSSPEKEELRYTSRGQRLVISLSISGFIALLDYMLGRMRDRR